MKKKGFDATLVYRMVPVHHFEVTVRVPYERLDTIVVFKLMMDTDYPNSDEAMVGTPLITAPANLLIPQNACDSFTFGWRRRRGKGSPSCHAAPPTRS